MKAYQMDIHDIYHRLKDFQALLAVWTTHENDNVPPGGATPVALPGRLPASIVFPMKLAHGGVR
jgi:hypothetical protein